MAKLTTRDAALSRLFGNAPERNVSTSREAESVPAETKSVKSPPSKIASRGREHDPPAGDSAAGRGGARAAPEASSPGPAPSSYIGLGRYSRTDGVVERITPYVRPDQAEALRLAAARKNDPRGTDISQIVQALLDEAGYAG